MSNCNIVIILGNIVIVNAGEKITMADVDSIADKDVISISSDEEEDNVIIIDDDDDDECCDAIIITDEEDDSDDDEEEALRGESPLSSVLDYDMNAIYDTDSGLSLSVSQIEGDGRPPSRGSLIMSDDTLINEQTSDYYSIT